MRKMLGVVVLGALFVTLMAASPAAAAWPAGSSFLVIDLAGFDIECIDIRSSGTSVRYFWAGKAGAAVLALDHTGAGRSSMTSTLNNGVFGGFYPTKETFSDCNFSRRGSSWWYLIAAPIFKGTGSCEATYRGFPGGGTYNESLNLIEIGGGHDCAWFYGARPDAKGPLFKSTMGTRSR